MALHMIPKESRILLVDDSLVMRMTVTSALSSAGYKDVQGASNGKEALERIKEALRDGTMYKVIFLDWNMPEMDGLAFLHACREELGLKDVAIIMLTAVTDQKSMMMALTHGATSYITKPVSSEIILEKMEQVGSWLGTEGGAS